MEHTTLQSSDPSLTPTRSLPLYSTLTLVKTMSANVADSELLRFFEKLMPTIENGRYARSGQPERKPRVTVLFRGLTVVPRS